MHTMTKGYKEHQNSYVVQCSCGWKEKAIDWDTAKKRFKHHQEYPHRPEKVNG